MGLQLNAVQNNVQTQQAQSVDLGDGADRAGGRRETVAAGGGATIEQPRDLVVSGATVNESEAIRASYVGSGSDAASTLRAKDATGEGNPMRMGAQTRLVAEQTTVQAGNRAT